MDAAYHAVYNAVCAGKCDPSPNFNLLGLGSLTPFFMLLCGRVNSDFQSLAGGAQVKGSEANVGSDPPPSRARGGVIDRDRKSRFFMIFVVFVIFMMFVIFVMFMIFRDFVIS